MIRMSRKALSCGAAILALSSIAAAAPRSQPTMDQLQAALVMTIARFVEWPAASFDSVSAPLVMAVVSDDAAAMALETAASGRQVNGRPIALRRVRWDSAMHGVHLLLVGEAEERRVTVLLDRLRGQHVLTVSSLPDFAAAGGMLTIVPLDGRVSFRINAAAADSGLRLSSFLRAHATRVPDPPRLRED